MPLTAITRLYLDESRRASMLDHAQSCLPEEACGMLAGLPLAAEPGAAQVRAVLPVENILHSPTRFRMEPLAQLRALQHIEERGLDLLAIFHSHPTGPEHPSPTDLAEFAYPGVLTLILIPHTSTGWQARAFAIQGIFDAQAGVHEVPLVTGSLPQPGLW